MHVGRQALRDRDLLNDASNATGSQASAAPVNQECRRVLPDVYQTSLTGREIGHQSVLNRLPERHIALLLALASNQDRLRAHPNIFEIDPCQLRVADTA